jgi:hypothetical protein
VGDYCAVTWGMKKLRAAGHAIVRNEYVVGSTDPAIGEIERNILLDMNGLMVRSKTYKYGEKFQISTP